VIIARQTDSHGHRGRFVTRANSPLLRLFLLPISDDASLDRSRR
jgi:hypothetical protein